MKYEVIDTFHKKTYMTGGILCDLLGKGEGLTPDFICNIFSWRGLCEDEEYLQLRNGFLWYHYNGSEWKKTPILQGYANPVGKTAVDITGNGKLDVVFSEWHNADIKDEVRMGGNIYWGEQPEDPFHMPWPIHHIAEGHLVAHDIVAGDVDGDGKPELIIRNKSLNLCMLKMPENPRDRWIETEIASHHEGDGTALFDITGNDGLDIVTASGFYENVDGKGNSWRFVSFGIEDLALDPETRIAVADLRGDHSVSVVITESELFKHARIVIVTSEDHGKTWTRKMIVDRERDFHALHSLQLYDITGNGLPDIFTVEMEYGKTDGVNRKPRWYVFINKGNLTFDEKILLDENLGGHQACVGPITENGKISFMANSFNPNKVNGCNGRNHIVLVPWQGVPK